LDFGGYMGYDKCYAFVKGVNLTPSQWDGFVSETEAILQNKLDNTSNEEADAFVNIFQFNNTVLSIEGGANFNEWFVSNRYLIHFNFGYLEGKSDSALAKIYMDAITEMCGTPVPEVSKAKAVDSKTLIAGNMRNGWQKLTKQTIRNNNRFANARSSRAMV
jgi:hypothetical protein